MIPSLPADLVVTETGNLDAPIALVLHGGGGPQTVAPIVAHLAPSFHVLAPTHPGWNGTSRPEDIDSVPALAAAYLDRLHADGGKDVLIVGSSLGGWIALEMAVQAAADERYSGVIGAIVNVDGVGAVVDGEPIADFFSLSPRQLAEAAWHDPDRGYMDPAAFTDEQRAMQQSNGQTMAVLAGRSMSDPDLIGKLHAIAVPTLVLFGDSDRVVTPAYGRAVAAAIPSADFAIVSEAGHLPHLENPDATWVLLDAFLGRR
ncbi:MULTISPECIES: alpha/beta fold hydrolase [unclassified Curtobacterium]|uniref:alpha/beta fold hydrolase n=1 Tax=unclassified Curtobacterium TaxID=257496 RepID=UPI0008DD2596|nr:MULTISPECIES: alpha/beta fold hydrolase [unclassified Curtobacterium]OIH94182.1 hydrolase [Curtobacterium sp. MCBA15_003]OII29322.1 hydrolase [Curtobacterium sp. MMLR14_006]